MMKGILVDPYTKSSIVEVKDKLDDYLKLIGCDCIDIVKRRIGNKMYCIVCDDCAFLKAGYKISAISTINHPMAGKLLILNDDGEDLKELTNDDVDNVSKYIFKYPSTFLMFDAIKEDRL